MTSERCLIFVGDIHGELKKLIWKTSNQYELSHVDLIICGDFGVGFGRENSITHLYNSVKNKLESYDINIYAIRGNHDDPKYFDGKHNFERLKFLEDYKIIELSGVTILPIGGAVSIDQEDRKKYNEKMKRFGSSKRSWWPDEAVSRINLKELPSKVDIVVSHCAPISFTPMFFRDSSIDPNIWESIMNDRNYLEEVKSNISYKYWIFGHYHKSTSGSFGDSLYRCLDILEFFEFKN